MHFYAFHLAEYAAHTRHLTPMEDLAYRRLLDAYYLAERAPQGTVEQIARSVGLRTELDAVASVLGEFFSSTSEGWINARCERELATYRERREQAAAAGRASGAKRRSNVRSATVERTLNDRSALVEQQFNDRSTTVGFQLNHNYNYKDKDKDKDNGSQRERDRARDSMPDESIVSKGRVRSRPDGRSLTPLREDALGSSIIDDRSDPIRPTIQTPIVEPARVYEASRAFSTEVTPAREPPSVEEIMAAWSEAGLPPASRTACELVIDRAIRLKMDRDLDWCKMYFARIARSPWCRGEVHDHPRCHPWSLEYAIGNDRRIADVLSGKFDSLPSRAKAIDSPIRTEHGFAMEVLDPALIKGVSFRAPKATVKDSTQPSIRSSVTIENEWIESIDSSVEESRQIARREIEKELGGRPF